MLKDERVSSGSLCWKQVKCAPLSSFGNLPFSLQGGCHKERGMSFPGKGGSHCDGYPWRLFKTTVMQRAHRNIGKMSGFRLQVTRIRITKLLGGLAQQT
ncbi:hypothetical protein CEXT_211581 [Caerostris extrusa]|uniref:Uncharacterized protein n=1 Tax=Caerostris extrusa TaxID=172846 RepID=A0AAV4WZ71_CAEEX|nr:hypothetical protein CEXT_211581 [Caerostris extrusa]